MTIPSVGVKENRDPNAVFEGLKEKIASISPLLRNTISYVWCDVTKIRPISIES